MVFLWAYSWVGLGPPRWAPEDRVNESVKYKSWNWLRSVVFHILSKHLYSHSSSKLSNTLNRPRHNREGTSDISPLKLNNTYIIQNYCIDAMDSMRPFEWSRSRPEKTNSTNEMNSSLILVYWLCDSTSLGITLSWSLLKLLWSFHWRLSIIKRIYYGDMNQMLCHQERTCQSHNVICKNAWMNHRENQTILKIYGIWLKCAYGRTKLTVM